MAQSKSSKLAKRNLREGKRDFRNSRGGQDIAISTVTKSTPTKKKMLDKMSKAEDKKILNKYRNY